jgi:hypothetical protein
MEQTLNENILDPVQQTRCKDLFIGPDYQVLQTKVKNQILDPIYKWLEKMGYPYEEHVRSIHIIGSSVGWQYTNTSDIDVSIETDIDPAKIKQIWKLLPNGQLLKEHPVNYYLTSDLKDVTESENAYDVLQDTWVKKQNKEELKKHIPFNYVMEIAKFFLSGVDDRIQEYEADKVELDYLKNATKDDGVDEKELKELITQKETELKADLDAINVAHQMLKSFRWQAFQGNNPTDLIIDVKTKANGSINNLLYKMIMDKLKYEEKLKKYEQLRENLQKNGHL